MTCSRIWPRGSRNRGLLPSFWKGHFKTIYSERPDWNFSWQVLACRVATLALSSYTLAHSS